MNYRGFSIAPCIDGVGWIGMRVGVVLTGSTLQDLMRKIETNDDGP